MDFKEQTRKWPLVGEMSEYRDVFWGNPNYSPGCLEKSGESVGEQRAHRELSEKETVPFCREDIVDAEARLSRFAPYIKKVFPETESAGGLIESSLKEIPHMADTLDIKGRLFLKCDSHLPISGSIKARGGIYEILKFAETIAAERGMLSEQDDYSKLAEPEFRELFSNFRVAVGSTGNLGLSIGMISAALGFKAIVHMSHDARKWKKDLLRSRGVTVVEHPQDYQNAVAVGRKQAEEDSSCHFVDDENSRDLFLGYAVAGKRLKKQIEEQNIIVDKKHPLFVYLPCGVGGAPGGVTFGVKTFLGPHAHCILAEPVHAPCMTLGLATGLKEKICIQDIGLDGITEADGLAVGRCSALAANVLEKVVQGCYTIQDEKLFQYLSLLADTEGIRIEPSACAGFEGPPHILYDDTCEATHIVWATGGSMVPEEEMACYYERGRKQQPIRK